jgi:hypothetical protein
MGTIVPHDGAIMMARSQISLPAEEEERARVRAAELGISMAEYIRRQRALHSDGEPTEP